MSARIFARESVLVCACARMCPRVGVCVRVCVRVFCVYLGLCEGGCVFGNAGQSLIDAFANDGFNQLGDKTPDGGFVNGNNWNRWNYSVCLACLGTGVSECACVCARDCVCV